MAPGICRLDFSTLHFVPFELPLRRTADQVRHSLLPPQRGYYWRCDLLGYSTSASVPYYYFNYDINLMELQDKWSAVYSVQTILLSLQSLLGGTLAFGNLNLYHFQLYNRA